jgi:hypothetical protein
MSGRSNFHNLWGREAEGQAIGQKGRLHCIAIYAINFRAHEHYQVNFEKFFKHSKWFWYQLGLGVTTLKYHKYKQDLSKIFTILSSPYRERLNKHTVSSLEPSEIHKPQKASAKPYNIETCLNLLNHFLNWSPTWNILSGKIMGSHEEISLRQ